MPGEPHVCRDSQRERESRLRERRIAALAERQHGVVTRDQLRESGLGDGAIDARLARRRLLPIHRGVYAVGHRGRSVEARWTAAVLALRPGAVLSHRSALALWGLGREDRAIDVTVPTNRRGRHGLRVHTNALREDETCLLDHLPATTVARTLLDAAAVVDRERLARAVSEAERRGLGDSPSLPELIARHPGARGLTNLRAILADSRLGLDVALSELEIRFLAFLRDRDLPRPEVNVRSRSAGGGWRSIACGERHGSPSSSTAVPTIRAGGQPTRIERATSPSLLQGCARRVSPGTASTKTRTGSRPSSVLSWTPAPPAPR